jgi:hypothetical protein
MNAYCYLAMDLLVLVTKIWAFTWLLDQARRLEESQEAGRRGGLCLCARAAFLYERTRALGFGVAAVNLLTAEAGGATQLAAARPRGGAAPLPAGCGGPLRAGAGGSRKQRPQIRRGPRSKSRCRCGE